MGREGDGCCVQKKSELRRDFSSLSVGMDMSVSVIDEAHRDRVPFLTSFQKQKNFHPTPCARMIGSSERANEDVSAESVHITAAELNECVFFYFVAG